MCHPTPQNPFRFLNAQPGGSGCEINDDGDSTDGRGTIALALSHSQKECAGHVCNCHGMTSQASYFGQQLC